MGYNTRFTLDIKPVESYLSLSIVKREEIIRDLRERNEEAAYVLKNDGDSDDAGRWYECERDMREFSKRYPSLLFVLSSEGEENEDMCKRYFVNGKMQEAKAVITFEEFDTGKLI